MDVDLESNGLQRKEKPLREEFRSLLNFNSVSNGDVTVESVRVINCEIDRQVTKKRREIKTDFNSQILQTINSAITENILPTL